MSADYVMRCPACNEDELRVYDSSYLEEIMGTAYYFVEVEAWCRHCGAHYKRVNEDAIEVEPTV